MRNDFHMEKREEEGKRRRTKEEEEKEYTRVELLLLLLLSLIWVMRVVHDGRLHHPDYLRYISRSTMIGVAWEERGGGGGGGLK